MPFTVVFDGNLEDFEDNPLDFESDFGRVIGISKGDLISAIDIQRERCAKIAEEFPDRMLVVYDRPGSPPGNTYVHISGQALIAKAIRSIV